MSRRLIINLALLLIVIMLAILAWKQPGVAPPADAQPITSLHAADATHVVITWPTAADERLPVRLEKVQGTWRMTAPLQTYANEFRIDALLRVVETASHARFSALGRDLREYGLDAPRVVLEVDGTRIAFGGSEGIDHRRYLMVGDTIHLTDDLYLFRLQTDHAGFISTRLLPPDSRPTIIESPGLTLVRGENGRWAASPAGDFTPDVINETVDEWRRAQAVAVELAKDSGIGVGSGSDEVRVRLDSGEDIRFEVHERGIDLLLVRPDLAVGYVLMEEQAQRLLADRDAPESALDPAPES